MSDSVSVELTAVYLSHRKLAVTTKDWGSFYGREGSLFQDSCMHQGKHSKELELKTVRSTYYMLTFTRNLHNGPIFAMACEMNKHLRA